MSPEGQYMVQLFQVQSIKIYEPHEIDSVPGVHVDPCEIVKPKKKRQKRQKNESLKPLHLIMNLSQEP